MLTEAGTTLDASDIATKLFDVRAFTRRLIEPLTAEDCAIQSMPDVSPTRWHLAHTTWFFETFILKQLAGFQPYKAEYEYLFNSYYNAVGQQYPRDRRGLLSRPSLAEVLEYRHHVDERLRLAIEDERLDAPLLNLLRLGVEHEQQHQELMLTDIKHVFGCNPLFPTYRSGEFAVSAPVVPLAFVDYQEGLREIGIDGADFCFDNESPCHKAYVHPYAIAQRCVTNAEYRAFIDDDGYRCPDHWLSMGWQAVCDNDWKGPLYWVKKGEVWYEFTLSGLVPLQDNLPVCHVSYFEADAFARWSGQRLPTEAEWECACQAGEGGAFIEALLDDRQAVHPCSAREGNGGDGHATAPAGPTPILQMLGDVWEWTSSQYTPYPGFAAGKGAIGEYNGKFMCNQFVLRGGSCATSESHIRPTYRNFFPPSARWQFSGIRLAK